jgi:hypothetical protein
VNILIINYTVAYRPVAKRRLGKQRQLLSNGARNTCPLLGSRFLIIQQLDATLEELCFLCGPYRDVIKQGSKLVVGSGREAVKIGHLSKMVYFSCLLSDTSLKHRICDIISSQDERLVMEGPHTNTQPHTKVKTDFVHSSTQQRTLLIGVFISYQ